MYCFEISSWNLKKMREEEIYGIYI
jgi:hypothetical protein